jgi:hypothetical protein
MDITIDEYISALEVVEKYHLQLKNKIVSIDIGSKHGIDRFLRESEGKITPVLMKALLKHKNTSGCLYVEDIDIQKISNSVGIGPASKRKLQLIINSYLNDR